MTQTATSKKYQIYAMGNALVDFEIETTQEELARLDVEKGVMTLIDEVRQDRLFHGLGGVHHKRACGGSAANSIIGAQSLGAQCFYSCKVANDDTGHFYCDDLLGHGVHSNLQYEALSEGKTGKCLVMITEDADRTMNTFLGITGDIGLAQINKEALLNSEYFYTEGYLSSAQIGLDAAAEIMSFAKANGIKTAFSLSDPNMVKFCRQGIDKIIGDGLDLLFCNLDEALMYTGQVDCQAACEKLRAIARTLVITLGPKGAVIVNQDETIQIDGNPVVAVDTNGAGDLFAGAFLYALTAGFSLEHAGKLASFASSRLVTQFGPRLTDEKLAEVKVYIAQLSVA